MSLQSISVTISWYCHCLEVNTVTLSLLGVSLVQMHVPYGYMYVWLGQPGSLLWSVIYSTMWQLNLSTKSDFRRRYIFIYCQVAQISLTPTVSDIFRNVTNGTLINQPNQENRTWYQEAERSGPKLGVSQRNWTGYSFGALVLYHVVHIIWEQLLCRMQKTNLSHIYVFRKFHDLMWFLSIKWLDKTV